MASSSSKTALKTFSLANDILEVSQKDEMFEFDAAANRAVYNAAPWGKDPHYFKTCRISAVALIKMVIHARSGVPYEIMGLMQGKIIGTSLVVMDSFALPVQGTETRVNTLESANEYMVEYTTVGEKVGELGNILGWYHSHPGYGCWLSGIDVTTQSTHQKFQDPFVAVVIDPNRTVSAGKVDIGAFRTFPEGYTPMSSSGGSEYQSIPLAKIEDFGVHANQYYSLDVEIFKSELDEELLAKLWNKYWVNTLSSSPLISNRAYAVSQLTDLHSKLSNAQKSIASTRPTLPSYSKTAGSESQSSGLITPGTKGKEKEIEKKEEKKEDGQLLKSVKDAMKIAAEAQHGLIAQVLKDTIFSVRLRQGSASMGEPGPLTPDPKGMEGIVETATVTTA
ncbi:JAB1/Mov34/MPN/PAD-1 ubiquitin protease-domain-containing protein [Gautieria morchelliformis]|nr:JAB1/Mov34/MPN/PAD-1 ubiquitin protease-domain-containing protein [Gautieria morchelliformis]